MEDSLDSIRKANGTIDITSLPRWDSTVPDETGVPDDVEEKKRLEEKEATEKKRSTDIMSASFFAILSRKPKEKKPEKKAPEIKFKFNPKINRQIIICRTDITCLIADAIVNTTNERLTEKTGVSGRIFAKAGPKLSAHCDTLEGCPTGDAIITPGFNLNATHVIHTVGPRYSTKYATAAENALHGCYRRVMEVLKDNDLHSIAFPPVNTDRKGYPKKAAAHVGIRTIRRFLEKYGKSLHTVAILLDTELDFATWESLMPLYFPRSLKEARRVQPLLPEDVGDDMGENVIVARKIKISAPVVPRSDAKADSKVSVSKNLMCSDDFLGMQDDPDTRRRRADAALSPEDRAKLDLDRKYKRYLRLAREEDLSDVHQYKFVYQSGVDEKGRAVVVVLGAHFPAKAIPLERCLLYLIQTLDRIVSKEYVVVYFHTQIQEANQPPYEWLQTCYSIFNRKYKKNMKKLFIVHPSNWVRLAVFFSTPFVSSKFWKKLQYVYKLHELYQHVDARAVDIPGHIIKWDDQMFGAEYLAKARTDRAQANLAKASEKEI